MLGLYTDDGSHVRKNVLGTADAFSLNSELSSGIVRVRLETSSPPQNDVTARKIHEVSTLTSLDSNHYKYPCKWSTSCTYK